MDDKITIEEAKKMLGTEFTFIYKDGDEVQAYVKMFDENIGLTCITLTTKTRDKWKPSKDNQIIEDDGTWCVIGYHFEDHQLIEALKILTEIKTTNVFDSRKHLDYFKGSFPVSCAFS